MIKMAIEDPFIDPLSADEADRGNSISIEDTLTVDKNASLTLGTDSLIVLGKPRWHPKRTTVNPITDESFEKTDGTNCCGLWPSGMRPASDTSEMKML